MIFSPFRYAPKTEEKITWAVKMFKEWQRSRNQKAFKPGSTLSPILVDLEQMTVDEVNEVNYSICRFITEVRRVDGAEYPGDTIRSLVIMLQLYLEVCGNAYKLLIDDRFAQIRNSLDNVRKSRARSGIGVTKRQAEIITVEEKDILGTGDPKTLLRTIFYVVGLNFALRGGEEHRSLRHGDDFQIHSSACPRAIPFHVTIKGMLNVT
jgi:hypothetical protein